MTQFGKAKIIRRNTDKPDSVNHSTNENIDKGNKYDKFGENTCKDIQYRVYKKLIQTNKGRAETTAGKWAKVMTQQFTGRKRPKTYQACDKSSNISNQKSGHENNNTLHAPTRQQLASKVRSSAAGE